MDRENPSQDWTVNCAKSNVMWHILTAIIWLMWSRESSLNKRLHYTPLVPLLVLLLVRSTLSYMQIKSLFASNDNAHSTSNYRTLSPLRRDTTAHVMVFWQMQKFMCSCTVFALFYFEFEDNFQVKIPGYFYLEGRFTGGFFALRVWGAYTWRGLLFSEFCGILY